MKTFLVEIALANCAAKLSAVKLVDNYAVFGAMERYRHLDPAGVRETDGIDDVPEKAANFCFGARIGKVLARHAGALPAQDELVREAQVARVLFAPLPADTAYPVEVRRQTLLTVIKALVKRAQIRTHTAKPGYEDINTWMDRYHRLQTDYREYLPRLVDAIAAPTSRELAQAEEFLSTRDALVALAVSKEPFTPGQLELALAQEPASTFGKMLRETLTGQPCPV